MFSFFKRKPAASDETTAAADVPAGEAGEASPADAARSASSPAQPAGSRGLGRTVRSIFGFGGKGPGEEPAKAGSERHADDSSGDASAMSTGEDDFPDTLPPERVAPQALPPVQPSRATDPALPPRSAPVPEKAGKATSGATGATTGQPARSSSNAPSVPAAPLPEPAPATDAEERRGWMNRLRTGLRKTGQSISGAFTGTRIDESLYEELEAALLMADAGVKATEYLLADLRRRVRDARATEPEVVRELLADAIADLLQPLQAPLVVGEFTPTVIMVAGVNGAGKTTTIGKLTRHLAQAQCKVLLAAADTFRAAAREQLAVWADRNQVEIVSQEGGDPSAVTFDAVKAGIARKRDVVIADTAGRLPTQLHLMEELKKLRRTIVKAMEGAPHEVLLVVDGNTGQNALAQVKAFDEALGLTGLVVTKLDGTAKGGVLAAIALWARDRDTAGGSRRGVPVYFIGVGEKLEDLQTFDAREFAQALLGI